ncbi:MAG TPA: ABC transporter substrate binding protein [Thermoanaerobaculia bacterium]|jgi:putative ABC transport system substrate-binding protein
MRRIAVLNSYNLPGVAGRDTLRVRTFLEGLAAAGWREGSDFELVLVDEEDRPRMEGEARRLAADGVDLFHAIGTPNAVAAARASATIPVVYYGAHPEGVADEVCGAPNVTGRIFALPFTASYKNFRFVRRFLPRVRTVWTPFFEGTVFVRPEMRELHRAARDRAGRRVWLSGSAGPVGFRTLAGLAYIVGVEYRELVYADAEELERALAEADPADGMLMPYNESFHCPGAVDTVLRVSRERGLPVIWNNNAQIAACGVLAGIGADWALLGRQSGEAAARILDGTPPAALPRTPHPNQVGWLNLDVAQRLGLDFDDEVLSYFERRITGPTSAMCM